MTGSRLRYAALFLILLNISGAWLWAQPQEQTDDKTVQQGESLNQGGRSVLSARNMLSWLPPGVQDLLKREDLGYPLWRIICVVLIFILGFLLNRLVAFIIKRYSGRLEAKSKAGERSFFISMVLTIRRPVRILVWAAIVRLAGYVLTQDFAPAAIWMSDVIINIAVVVFIYDFVGILEYFLLNKVKKTESRLDDMLIPILKTSLRTIVIGLAAIQLFQSISGQNITTILAGLGLAGMAVALGAQDTIKNFFGFLMIVLDKPFAIGERIDFNGHDGVVEKVGLRSTKMRRLDGHVVTIPNMLAADNVIHNIGRREHIRRIMNIGITYDTPPSKVEQAIKILKHVLENHEGMHPDWPPYVFFNEFLDSALNIFAIYWYHPPAYWDYMKHAEQVNIRILREFNEAGIGFAFPTKTVHVVRDPELEAFLAAVETRQTETKRSAAEAGPVGAGPPKAGTVGTGPAAAKTAGDEAGPA